MTGSAIVEVRHLKAFVAVAEELHFARAAARLQLSPSPVSRTVLELERELGVELFVRSHHQVRLTEAGTALLPTARQLLGSWAAFTAHGRALARDSGAPRIRLGSPSLAPSTVADQVAALLAELQPDIPVAIEFEASVDLLAALRARELDLTVAHLPVEEPDLQVMPLARYEFGAVVPADDELAQRTDITVDDLAARRVLMVTSAVQPATLERMTRWLTGAGAVVEQLPDPDLVRLAQLVHHGHGVTLIGTTGVAAQIFAQPGLTVVPMRDTGPGVELGLVWRADSGPSALIQELTCRLAELIDKGPMYV
ncbi:LysR family transcriptional regulator [Streptomyces sp. NPDC088337]|uniref:LysR family transcriptional regulator n=1 Tax=unclassified Streptomyces TaxID=2593676 RepID=UPI00381DE849